MSLSCAVAACGIPPVTTMISASSLRPGSSSRCKLLRLGPAPARRGLVPLEQALVDPAGNRRGRDLTHACDTLGAPIPGSSGIHGTQRTTKTGNTQGVLLG